MLGLVAVLEAYYSFEKSDNRHGTEPPRVESTGLAHIVKIIISLALLHCGPPPNVHPL
jgi:hypothetical protein